MNKRNKLLIPIMLLICAILLLSVSVAWLMSAQWSNMKIVISDAEIQTYVNFVASDNADNTVDITTMLSGGSVLTDDGLVYVSLDPTSDNYIGNLRVAVRYSGSSPVYLRVRVVDQWTSNDIYISADSIPYTVMTGDDIVSYTDSSLKVLTEPSDYDGIWYDNTLNDFCYYYDTQLVPPYYMDETYNNEFLYLINGIKPNNMNEMLSSVNEDAELQILVQVEAVQPNRYREFWKLESLPWEN